MIINKDIIAFIKIYPLRSKLLFLASIFASFCYSVSEMISIGIIIPLISVIISPDLISKNRSFQGVLNFFHLTTDDDIRFYFLIFSGIIVLLTTIIKITTFWFNTRVTSHIGTVTGDLLFRKVLYAKYLHLKSVELDEIISLFSIKVEYVSYYIVLPLINFFSSIIQVLLIFSLLLFINLKVTLVTFAFFSLQYLIISRYSRKSLNKISKIISNISPGVVQITRDMILGFREISLYDKKDDFIKINHSNYSSLFGSQSKSLFIASYPKYLLEGVAMVFLIGVVYVQFSSGGDLKVIIPLLAGFVLALQRLLPSFQLAFNSYATIKSHLVSFFVLVDSYRKFEQNAEEVEQSPSPKDSLRFDNIDFTNVSFFYGQFPVLENVSIAINRGDQIFIHGSSGSGKSTFIDIFCGFLDNYNGTIAVNGDDNFRQIQSQWRKLIAYVPQRIHILNGSFYENIAFTRDISVIDKEAAEHCARLSGLDSIINEHPDKYERAINSDVGTLSGGQMKRLAISRALYLNRSIIIFDEATAGLDAKSEQEIVDTLVSLGKEKTVIFISHNISLATSFSRTLFIDKKVIRELVS